LIYLKHPYVRSRFHILIATHQEAGNMGDFRSVIMSAFLTLAAWTATVNPSQADTGTVRIVFSAAGVVASVGSGRGTLTFHGNTYPFTVSGASFGATTTGPLFLFDTPRMRWKIKTPTQGDGWAGAA
jgi:hypothetical protein